jgi:probable O-glycosylation ligase (exosortase A-associated)
MRDLVILLFVVATVPLAMRSTLTAVLLWSWGGLIGLNGLGYGMAQSVPTVQLFALVGLIGLFVRQQWPLVKAEFQGFPKILLVLIVHGFLCAVFAYPGVVDNWYLFTNVAKTALLCAILPAFLLERSRINLFIVVIASGIGFHGVLDGLKYVASGGGHHAGGIAKFGDNNHYGMMLAMVVPLQIYLARFAKHWMLRLAWSGAVVLNVLGVMATNSRGAMLSTVVTVAWLVLFSKKKLAGLMVFLAVGFVALNLAPESWFNRMNTIQAADQDDSFMGRVTAWKRASAIALANPAFGGGYHAGQSWAIFEEFRYKPGLLGAVQTPDVPRPAASHSIYFEVMGDLGFLGLVIFLICMFSPFYFWLHMRRSLQRFDKSQEWMLALGVALSGGMVAYLVGGAALSVAYHEVPYYFCVAMYALHLQVERLAKNQARGQK